MNRSRPCSMIAASSLWSIACVSAVARHTNQIYLLSDREPEPAGS